VAPAAGHCDEGHGGLGAGQGKPRRREVNPRRPRDYATPCGALRPLLGVVTSVHSGAGEARTATAPRHDHPRAITGQGAQRCTGTPTTATTGSPRSVVFRLDRCQRAAEPMLPRIGRTGARRRLSASCRAAWASPRAAPATRRQTTLAATSQMTRMQRIVTITSSSRLRSLTTSLFVGRHGRFLEPTFGRKRRPFWCGSRRRSQSDGRQCGDDSRRAPASCASHGARRRRRTCRRRGQGRATRQGSRG
jgi:hypothetical protein